MLQDNSEPDVYTMIKEFDALYAHEAPLRYEQLNPGYTGGDLKQRFQVDYLPDDYVQLYQWKNGFRALAGGWRNEFNHEEELYYEMIPLLEMYHWLSVESVLYYQTAIERITHEKRSRGELCQWKPGFILFQLGLAVPDEWLVIDTVGYFGGVPGQIMTVDVVARKDVYRVVSRSVTHWLLHDIMLIKAGVFGHGDDKEWYEQEEEIDEQINGVYVHQFKNSVMKPE